MADADALQQGLALHQSGRLREALEHYQRILKKRPRHPEALYLAGMASFQMGDPAQAIEKLRAAITVKPDFAEAQSNLGVVLEATGDLDKAAAAYRRAIELDPGSADAHFNLGNALHQAGDLGGAEAAYRRAVEIKPDDAQVHNNLGVVLEAAGEYDAAVESYGRALEIAPEHSKAMDHLVRLWLELGDLQAALAFCRDAIEARPEDAFLHNLLGTVLQFSGNLEEAEAAYRRAIALSPDGAEYYRNLALLKTHQAGDGGLEEDIAEMESRLSRPLISDAEAIHLCFALAKIYEDLGDFERAFGHLERGNGLCRAAVPFEIESSEKFVGRLVKAFNAPLFESRAGQGCASEAPIFIVGMPRSGTSLVEQILASHSQVFGAGEVTNLAMAVQRLGRKLGSGRNYPDDIAKASADDLRALGQDYADALGRRARGSPRATDKLPSNFLSVGLIHLILPKARIIHCVRDPVDTCFSCYKMLFEAGQAFAYDLAELGRYYRLYDRLMAHWRAVLPESVLLDVRYEDIVADQEGQTRRLLEFCGLPWEDACLEFHQTGRAVRTASSTQVRRPIYGDAVGSWKNYESHLGPLLEALGPLARND